MKYKYEKFIFSLSNAYIIQYAVTLFLIAPLAFQPIAWVKLLGTNAYRSAQSYYPYLLKSFQINCFGFFVFCITLIMVEFSKSKPIFIYKYVKKSNYLYSKILDVEFYICLFIWIVYVVFFLGGFLLFGTENSAENGLSYYLNSAVQQIICMMTLYYGIEYINQKKYIKQLILGLIVLILIGKRATLIMDVLWGLVVYFLYKKIQASRKVFKLAIKYALVLIVIALVLGNLRTSTKSNFTIIENLLYGNTFSDIRDGAFILYGFENNTASQWVLGKTYLSALIGFIPSSLNNFRWEWDWGRYSTTQLHGWINHPGLRGGWAMEGYLNLGIIGIFLTQILAGIVYGQLEKFFKEKMFQSKEREIPAKAIFPIYILISLGRKITCSAGMHTLYVLIIFWSINIFIGKTLRKGVPNKYVSTYKHYSTDI